MSVIALCRALDGPWYLPVVTFVNTGPLNSRATSGVAMGSLDTDCDLSKDARKDAFSASSCSIRELEGLNAFSPDHDLRASFQVTFC